MFCEETLLPDFNCLCVMNGVVSREISDDMVVQQLNVAAFHRDLSLTDVLSPITFPEAHYLSGKGNTFLNPRNYKSGWFFNPEMTGVKICLNERDQ